ncbi:MAG: zinc-ribbon domain-containing protein [Deltaproteobacteria bacterium]|nr:zinc-ribbon domain-containing protein [Deltaproteobacteria bacterium]
MKCPHCDKDIPGSPCPQCDATNPDDAKYCMECGSFLGRKEKGATEDDNGFDFEDRVLCPDGNCTGIIENGKCTECGRTPEKAKKANKD